MNAAAILSTPSPSPPFQKIQKYNWGSGVILFHRGLPFQHHLYNLRMDARIAPWKEIVPELAKRMREIAHDVNAKFEVEGLCRAFPKRLQLLVDAEGDRIRA